MPGDAPKLEIDALSHFRARELMVQFRGVGTLGVLRDHRHRRNGDSSFLRSMFVTPEAFERQRLQRFRHSSPMEYPG